MSIGSQTAQSVPVIRPLPVAMDTEIQQAIDQKTKPVGALGRLETLAWQVARVQQTLCPRLDQPCVLVFAADHGIAAHGVSAYPQEVSWQMVLNFLQGGAAINALCQANGIELKVIDVGVNFNFAAADAFNPDTAIADKASPITVNRGAALVHAKVLEGTADMLHGPAMTTAECDQAILVGRQQVADSAIKGTNVFGFGDMGIANTTAASLLMHRLLELPLEDCVGRGTGLDDEQLQHKLTVLKKVSLRHSREQSPLRVLATMGGLEIAAIVGGMLEAARQQCLILVDGFIATAAYLVACRLQPAIVDYAVFSHCSKEAGHQQMLAQLGAQPLLDLSMRLGEGTGCAVAFPLLRSAVAMLNDMASFSDAGVSEG